MALADKKSALAPQQIVKTNPAGRHTGSPTSVNPFVQTITRQSPIQIDATVPTGRHNDSPTAVFEKTPLAGE